jgi:citrate lyase subunit beta / citryl-CoA lyase
VKRIWPRWGGVDLQRDLNTSGGNLQTLYARSYLVLASRAAGIEPPIDSVFPLLDDTAGLRDQAQFARSLGFFGKSAIHPRQLDILHEIFTPTEAEIEWAQSVLSGFEAAGGGGGFALPSGEFVDLPVAVAVTAAAAKEGLAQAALHDPIQQVHDAMWRPVYPRIEFETG